MVKTESAELKKAPKLNLRKPNHDLAVATKEMANKLSRRQIERNKRKERNLVIQYIQPTAIKSVQDKPPQCRERS